MNTKIPKITASRDLQALLVKGIIVPFDDAGGRSKKYKLNLEFIEPAGKDDLVPLWRN